MKRKAPKAEVTEEMVRDAVIQAIKDHYPVVEVWDEGDDKEHWHASRVCFEVTRATPEQIDRAERSGLEPPWPRSTSYVTVCVNDGTLEVTLSRMNRNLCHSLSVDYAAPDSFDEVIEFVATEYNDFLEKKEAAEKWRTSREKRLAARSNARIVRHTAG